MRDSGVRFFPVQSDSLATIHGSMPSMDPFMARLLATKLQKAMRIPRILSSWMVGSMVLSSLQRRMNLRFCRRLELTLNRLIPCSLFLGISGSLV